MIRSRSRKTLRLDCIGSASANEKPLTFLSDAAAPIRQLQRSPVEVRSSTDAPLRIAYLGLAGVLTPGGDALLQWLRYADRLGRWRLGTRKRRQLGQRRCWQPARARGERRSARDRRRRGR